MQTSMYSALFGALTNEHRMNNIANNLANVNTTGYKSDVMSFRDTFLSYAHDRIMEPVVHLRSEKLFPEPMHMAKTRISYSRTDFSQGSMKSTGGAFDLAICGDGFFKFQTPTGVFYSRNGQFQITSEGRLVTNQGFSVMSDGGEITVPAGTKHFTISESGEIYADGELVGQINLVDVDNKLNLEKIGGNMYRPRPGSQINEIEANGFLAQGFLEAANVNPVYEMVGMIEAQRQYEAYAKVMQTTEAVDKESISKVGRGRS